MRNIQSLPVVFVRCSRCGRDVRIVANDETIYTAEVRARFCCCLCDLKAVQEDAISIPV